jgi:hypothetical protein
MLERGCGELVLEGSGVCSWSDLKAACEVADFLGTDHHEFTFTVQVRVVAFCVLSVRRMLFQTELLSRCVCLQGAWQLVL